MNVVLKKALAPHGKPGDVIAVSESYARNFLLPRGIAVVATSAVVASAAQEKKRQSDHVERTKQEHQILVDRLASLTVHVAGRANANGKVYAAIQEPEIIRALAEEHHVRAHGLRFAGLPIKTTGQSTVEVLFPAGQKTTLQVEVTALP